LPAIGQRVYVEEGDEVATGFLFAGVASKRETASAIS
jgi:hypothetical protein